ncbi:MAG TPA: DUF6599 family protein [Candidatus Dormibacteraeota bacterium]|nr:DUF6599 family protein [Candidatus Dormibacteraeota bacterium]
MRRTMVLVTGVLLLAGLAMAAQQLLPSSFAGWTGTVQPGLSSSAVISSDRQAGVTVSQGSSALPEYGFVAGANGMYQKGGESMRVDVYRMKDPSGAYGLLTYLRAPDMTHAKLATHSFVSDDEALILTGNLVIDVHGRELQKRETDLKALARDVGAHAEVGALPTLWQELPAKRLVPGSDHYVLGPRTLNQFFPVAVGNSVGFNTGAEAEVARYRAGKGEATLLLVDLPTPQIATHTLSQLASQYDVNGSKPGAGEPLYAKRLMTTLVIVTGASAGAEATALLNQVQSGEVLTWNQPVPKGKQADIGTIVVGTIVGTGAICAFSLVAGLVFGGLRLAVKRAMPGKIFDTQKHLQVLQLGLLSKPIAAEDFYDRSGPRIKMGEVEKNLPDRVALRLFRGKEKG